MRIGLLIYGSLDILSGGFLYDRMLVQHLRCAGDQVEVISVPWPSYGRGLLMNLSTTILQHLKRLSFDLLLQDELIHPSFFWLNQRLHKQKEYPLIAIVHHLRCSEAWPAWQNWGYRWVEQRYLNSVDGFIFNSQTTQRVVEKLLRNARPAIVAPPGGDRLQSLVTPAYITTRARQPGPLELVFIGNLIPRKELHTLLDGLATLRSSQWRLSIIGNLDMDALYVQRIRKQIQRAGLTKRVMLLGALSDAELSARLRQSHVLIVISSYEGFGIVYLEGMGFGLPAIASLTGAAHEIITHGENGFLIPPEDFEALAARIHELIEDRERLLALSLAAYKHYQTHPTWSDSMTSFHQFLHNF